MYTDQSHVESYLGRDLTDEEEDQLDDTISHFTDFINAYTNRSWLPIDTDADENEEAVRLYNGTGSKNLDVDDFSEISQIRILDSQGSVHLTFNLATDWILTPANKTTKQTIRLRNYHFPVGVSNVEITGKWGSGEVPAGIVKACTALVGDYMNNLSALASPYKSESIEGYSYTLLTGADRSSSTINVIASLDTYKRLLL